LFLTVFYGICFATYKIYNRTKYYQTVLFYFRLKNHVGRDDLGAPCYIKQREVKVMASITSKELTALEDQLTMEQNIISKFKMYSHTAVDSVIKDKCECLAGKHQQHYDTLVSQLR